MDFLILRAVGDEVRRRLRGTRLSRVVQPSWRRLDLLFRTRRESHWLRLQIDPRRQGVVLSEPPEGKGLRDAPFKASLQRHALGTWLVGVRVPPGERILILDLERRHPRPERCRLVAELLGRSANILLVGADEGILECMRRLPPGEGIRRPQRAGETYLSPTPPPQPPATPEVPDLERALRSIPGAGGAGKAAAELRREMPWLPPGVARELVARPAGVAAMSLAGLLRAYHGEDLPCWQTAGRVTALPPEEPRDPCPSPSAAVLSNWLREERDERGRALHQKLDRGLENRATRLGRLAEHLDAELAETRHAGELQGRAELLMAHLKEVPRGTGQACLVGFDGVPVTLTLDPSLGALENARRWFRRAAKLKRGRKSVQGRREAVREARRAVEDLRGRLVETVELQDLRRLEEELRELGLPLEGSGSSRSEVLPERGPKRYRSPDGLVILVGRNAAGNERLTGSLASPRDFWLHAAGRSGAHVVVRNPGRLVKLPERTLQAAAQLAAHHSSGRRDTRVQVLVTQRKQVRKVRRGPPGLVRVTRSQSITIRPDAELVRDLEELPAAPGRSPPA